MDDKKIKKILNRYDNEVITNNEIVDNMLVHSSRNVFIPIKNVSYKEIHILLEVIKNNPEIKESDKLLLDDPQEISSVGAVAEPESERERQTYGNNLDDPQEISSLGTVAEPKSKRKSQPFGNNLNFSQKNPSDPVVGLEEGTPPLDSAEKYEKTEITDYKNYNSETNPFFEALLNGNVKKARSIIETYGNGLVNLSDLNGQPFLSYAVHIDKSKNGEMTDLFIKSGADVNTTDKRMRTALHIACSEGNLNAAKLLVAAGAKIDAKDNKGRTPLDLAKKYKRTEIIDFLDRLNSGVATTTTTTTTTTLSEKMDSLAVTPIPTGNQPKRRKMNESKIEKKGTQKQLQAFKKIKIWFSIC